MPEQQTPLVPPDYERCQCEIKQGSFLTLGPRRYERCSNKPVWLAVELVAGKDGRRGSMTLCNDCAKVMMDIKDLRERVQLQPIFCEEVCDADVR
jgi:hypothetical protein